MSSKRDIIEIVPPPFVDKKNLTECITSNNHLCSHCHGNGFFWQNEMNTAEKKTCPVCNGSGKLHATITIKWKPVKQ